MTNGQSANHTGKRLERFIELALREHGYTESKNGSDLFKRREVFRGLASTGIYATQVYVGTTAYGSNRKVDVFVVHKVAFPNDLIIECKWQQTGGSADEKLPNLVNNIQKTGVPTLTVIGGKGFKPASIAWLKKQVDGRNLLAVWDMDDFQAAVNRGFLSTGQIEQVHTSSRPRRITLYDAVSLWGEEVS